MKTIPLANGGYALVSDSDHAELSAYRWKGIESKPGYVYAARRDKEGRIIRMHRHVMGDAGQVIDHINGDTLDNQRENLRPCSYSENSANINRPPRGGSGHRNVYVFRDGYMVRLVRNGQPHYGGVFTSLADAIDARDKLADRISMIVAEEAA